MKKNTLALMSIVMTLLIFTTCKEEIEVTPLDIQLIVSPDTLIIMDDGEKVGKMFLSTKPKGKVDYTVTNIPNWLQVTPLEGSINGNIVPLEVIGFADNLDEGIYEGKIEIISNIGGSSSVAVKMIVEGHPKIKTNIEKLSFPANVSTIWIEIENIGTGLLNWHIEDLPDWISVSRRYGYLEHGEKSLLLVTCNRANLDIKTYSTNLIINSNSEVDLLALPIEMDVPELIDMQLTHSELLYDFFSEKKEFYLKNVGNTNLTWKSECENYLILSPSSGSLVRGDSVLVNVTIDRDNILSGTLNTTISLIYNLGNSKNINVDVNHFNDTKWILDRNIVDAEFCKHSNKIIIVSTSPNRLSIIDPELKQIKSVNLNTTPKCLSVKSDGSLAAVGHNGFVTYVDLNSQTIDREYSISCDAFDIAIADNNWTYITPNRDQWEYLRCVDYSNGRESLHTAVLNNSIYEKSKIKYLPNSNYIYLCNTSLSSTSLEKMDISDGTAKYLYQNFDASTSGDFWFSNNGKRIFTMGHKVYKTSELENEDLQYNGRIESLNSLLFVDHSETANKLFAVTYKREWYDQIISSQIEVFNDTYLNYLKTYEFEQFLVPSGIEGGRLVMAEGRYVFANRLGTKIYSIVKANNESGLLYDWAIQNINIE